MAGAGAHPPGKALCGHRFCSSGPSHLSHRALMTPPVHSCPQQYRPSFHSGSASPPRQAFAHAIPPTLTALPEPSAWLAVSILQVWFMQEAFPGHLCSMPSPVCTQALQFPFTCLPLSFPAPPSTRWNVPSSEKILLDSGTLDHKLHEGRGWVCPALSHPEPGRQWKPQVG